MGDVTNAVKFENWMLYGDLGHQPPPDWEDHVRKLYSDRAVLVAALREIGTCAMQYCKRHPCEGPCSSRDARVALAKVGETP